MSEFKIPDLITPKKPAPHPLAGPFEEVTDDERGLLDHAEKVFNRDPGIRSTYQKVENFAEYCLASRRGQL